MHTFYHHREINFSFLFIYLQFNSIPIKTLERVFNFFLWGLIHT